MNSASMKSKNIVNSVDIFNDSATMNSNYNNNVGVNNVPMNST